VKLKVNLLFVRNNFVDRVEAMTKNVFRVVRGVRSCYASLHGLLLSPLRLSLFPLQLVDVINLAQMLLFELQIVELRNSQFMVMLELVVSLLLLLVQNVGRQYLIAGRQQVVDAGANWS